MAKFWKSALLTVLVGGFCGLRIEAETPPLSIREEAAENISLRLDVPRYREMDGESIRNTLSRKILIIDQTYEPAPGVKINAIYLGGCPPKEHFFADGRWTAAECHATPRYFDGRWTIEDYRNGQRLCVEAVGREKDCRFVWRGPQANQVIMTDNDFKNDHGRASVFTLYRLEKDD